MYAFQERPSPEARNGPHAKNRESPDQVSKGQVSSPGGRRPYQASRAMGTADGVNDARRTDSTNKLSAPPTLGTMPEHRIKKAKTSSHSAMNTMAEIESDLESGGVTLDATIGYAEIPEDTPIIADALNEDVVQGPPPPTGKQKRKMAKQARLVSRDAGDVLQTISAEEVTPVQRNVTWDQDPELLCCYNWQDREDANTIFVPGGPPKWMPRPLPHTLKPDSGFCYSDYNYVRQPRDPYSPMFHALGAMKPDFCFNDVDVIADRNNLRVLLEFVSGKANGPFRLDLFLTLNTLMLARNGENFWKHQDAKNGGYGVNFEKAFTRPDDGMEDATSHYRAIRYPLGPLNVVCRFEADAYYDAASDELTTDEAAVVSGGLAAKPRFDFRAPIRVLQKGHIVPTAQIAELKTTVYKPENMSGVRCMDQLWFGRTSHLITGRYKAGAGTIDERRIKIEDATSKIKDWEQRQQENLQKLAGLLNQLRAVVRQERGPIRAAVLVREEKNGPIVIRRKEMKSSIVKREFFEKHWQLRPAHAGPTHFARGRGNAGRGLTFGRGSGPGYQQGGAQRDGQSHRPDYGRPNELHHGRGRPPHFAHGGAHNANRGGASAYVRSDSLDQERGTSTPRRGGHGLPRGRGGGYGYGPRGSGS